MSKSISVKIKLRKDTLANWNQHSNVILLDGEVALVVMTDGSIGIKIGDGSTTFGNLDYIVTAKTNTKSLSAGSTITNSGTGSTAIGNDLNVSGQNSIVSGTKAQSSEDYTFTWNGDSSRLTKYLSNGEGTFNINPKLGFDGIYIGSSKLKDLITNLLQGQVSNLLSGQTMPSNPTQKQLTISVKKIWEALGGGYDDNVQ